MRALEKLAKVKLLIAINSCHLYERCGANDVPRVTWLPDAAASGFDYRFFLGVWSPKLDLPHPGTAKSDAVILDAPDDYHSLCYKTHESLKWAVQNDYDFIFRCYPDTYVRPERLRASGFEQFDYSGNFEGGSMTAAGGPGYWLSRKAALVMLQHSVSPTHPNIGATFEDRWVGTCMNYYRDALTRKDERRLVEGAWLRPETSPRKSNDAISAHMWGGEGKQPETALRWVRSAHQAWEDSWKQ